MAATGGISGELSVLFDLHQQGALTAEEFTAAKQAVLARYSVPSDGPPTSVASPALAASQPESSSTNPSFQRLIQSQSPAEPNAAILPPMMESLEEATAGAGIVQVFDKKCNVQLQVPDQFIRRSECAENKIPVELCLDFLEDTCQRGSSCPLAHLHPSIVWNLRKRAIEICSCCQEHRGSLPKEWNKFTLTIAGTSVPLPMCRFRFSRGLQTLMQGHLERHTAKEIVREISISQAAICRHAVSMVGCKFGEGCLQVHICPRLFEQQLSDITKLDKHKELPRSKGMHAAPSVAPPARPLLFNATPMGTMPHAIFLGEPPPYPGVPLQEIVILQVPPGQQPATTPIQPIQFATLSGMGGVVQQPQLAQVITGVQPLDMLPPVD